MEQQQQPPTQPTQLRSKALTSQDSLQPSDGASPVHKLAAILSEASRLASCYYITNIIVFYGHLSTVVEISLARKAMLQYLNHRCV